MPRRHLPVVAALVIAAAIITFQIFIPPLIGLADSWDFERFLQQSGLAHVPETYEGKYFHYFNSHYKIVPRVEPADPEDQRAFKSSSLLPIRLSRWLSIAVGPDEFFDIRFQAALYTIILLFGMGMIFVALRPLRGPAQILLGGLLVLMLTDVGYVSYFNSFYSEGTAYPFLVVALGCSLLLITRQKAGALPLVGYFIAMTVVVTSKPQYVSLAPGAAVFGVYLASRLRGARRYWLAGGLALALGGFAVWYFNQSPPALKAQSAYVEIFMDLLPHSRTPQQDLTEMGLNPDYTAYSGTTPFQTNSPYNNPELQAELSTKVSTLTIPMFYLKHPGRLLALCERCMAFAFSTRVSRLGYYEAYTGKPAEAQAFGVWSTVRENLFPRSAAFLAFFLATGVGAVVWLVKARSAAARGLASLYLLFTFVAAAQFFIAVLVGGGEPDLEKHLFMFNLAFDICFVLFVLGAARLLQALWVVYGKRKAGQLPRQSGDSEFA